MDSKILSLLLLVIVAIGFSGAASACSLDSSVTATPNDQGQVSDISWNITKSADTSTASVDTDDQSVDVTYNVDVNKTKVKTQEKSDNITGTLTSKPVDANIKVADANTVQPKITLYKVGGVNIVDPSTYTVTYSAPTVVSKNNGKNIDTISWLYTILFNDPVTAVTGYKVVGSASASGFSTVDSKKVAVTLTPVDAIVNGFKKITVIDSYFGILGTTNKDDSFTYTRTFNYDDLVAGDNCFINIATINETEQSANATVCITKILPPVVPPIVPPVVPEVVTPVVKEVTSVKNEVAQTVEGTIPMQHTGVPLTPLAGALVTIAGSLFVGRRFNL